MSFTISSELLHFHVSMNQENVNSYRRVYCASATFLIDYIRQIH